ncbi:MAG: hypothetical protein V7637_2147, partial [Mycobacteriales bacterium]
WTSQVSATNALPEYPRPQLVRPDWQNLNGVWDFAVTARDAGQPGSFPLRILVPFPAESALSGIMQKITDQQRLWYHRTFTVPAGWSGRRVQLNFGAVDWQATVSVNGAMVGTHTGGYDAFSFDITGRLRAGGNDIVVGVYDPTDAAGQPVGKQRVDGGGIFYTASSGIWQTVWLEPTNAARITRLDTTPDVPGGVLDLVVQGAGVSGQRVHAAVSTGDTKLSVVDGPVGVHLRLPIPDAHLWSPDDPFLYDLQVNLTGPGGGDAATGYFGMRSIGKAVVGGVLRPVLNGRFVFQLGTLDQGFWPDGIYTAPTDAALAFDLRQQKALGFNTVRKHIKIEPARWYYWADRLGLLVWQDMPSMRTGPAPSTSDQVNFEAEAHRIVDQLRGYTSIVQWQPFNEGWGEYNAGHVADLFGSWDPSRLIDPNSGSNCCGSDPGNGDVVDDHIYVGPGGPQPPTASRVAVLGEFGALGFRVPGHEWSPGNGFSVEMEPDLAAVTRRYVEITAALRGLVESNGLSASIFTQPTDVENEVNGLFTYDRQVLKVDAGQVLAVNRSVLTAALGGVVTPNTLASLRVTTPGFTDRYLRHQDSLAGTSVITTASGGTDKLDATFWLRPGLADPACTSFEARDFPGQYLRHQNSRVRRDPRDGGARFDQDATWCARPGLTGAGTSFESLNFPGRYLRHFNAEVWLAADGGPNPSDTPAGFAPDATWRVTTPWWRSGADLPLDTNRSFRVTTPGFTDRYARHQNGLGVTSVITAASPTLDKQDATFTIRRGLADGSCYSLESRNFPGQYLRHQNFRIHLAGNDGTALFAQDATFCAQPGPGGPGVTLTSDNIAGHALRHFAAELWIAANGGPNPYDNPANYAADVTWSVTDPWAP